MLNELQSQGIKTIDKKKKEKKEKEKDNSIRLHLYYKLILLSLGRLGGSYCGGCKSFSFKVFLGGYGESFQHDLYVIGSLFLLGGLFEGVWRQVGILGHFLGGVYYLLNIHRLLYHHGGDVGCGKSSVWAFLAFICLLGDRVSLGARGADGWRVVHILCSSKGRGDLNPSSVEGLIPHWEAIESAHFRELSPEGILSLYHAHVIAVLLSLLLGLLSLL